eukprot:gene7237-7450_t
MQDRRIAAAAKMTGKSPKQLVSLMARDSSAFLTSSGALSYGCKLNSPEDQMQDAATFNQAAASAIVADAMPGPAVADADFADGLDAAQAFHMHSRRGALKTIFLQFQGCKTTGTDWNDYFGMKKIITPAYDSDEQPGFSENELRDIIIIWRGVAEHYSLWEVDVTTEDPGLEALDRSDTTDQVFGIRMCVGGNSSWTKTDIGGIATTYSFGWVNQPGGTVYRDAFVFSANLKDRSGQINLGYVWKSISHELGHTFGLGHDGTLKNGVRQEYFYPNGPTLWVPIMGVPGNGLFAQFSNGSYPPDVGAPTNTEDDIGVISASLPVRINQPGSKPTAPKVLCKHVPCVNSTDTGGFVVSSVQASMAGAEDDQYYSFTADADDKPTLITILYKPNWASITETGSDQKAYNNWRVSMLRLQLQFNDPKVNVTPSTVNQWSTHQVFKVQLPATGTYTFKVYPDLALDSSNTSVALPTMYGNVGRYQMIATFPSSNQKLTPVIKNQPPRAASDAYNTAYNTTLKGMNFSGNDTDPDGNVLSVLGTTEAKHGSLVRSPDGLYTYIPFELVSNVTDSFTYTVADGQGESAVGVVTIHIGPAPENRTTAADDQVKILVSTSEVPLPGGEDQSQDCRTNV